MVESWGLGLVLGLGLGLGFRIEGPGFMRMQHPCFSACMLTAMSECVSESVSE